MLKKGPREGPRKNQKNPRPPNARRYPRHSGTYAPCDPASCSDKGHEEGTVWGDALPCHRWSTVPADAGTRHDSQSPPRGWDVLMQGHLDDASTIQDARETVVGRGSDVINLTEGQKNFTGYLIRDLDRAVPKVDHHVLGLDQRNAKVELAVPDARLGDDVARPLGLKGKSHSSITKELHD